MVSGFVTSPCDQLRIFSGEARLMRIASKSAIGFARSKGLERNKISSTPALKASGQLSVARCQFLCSAMPRAEAAELVFQFLSAAAVFAVLATDNWQLLLNLPRHSVRASSPLP